MSDWITDRLPTEANADLQGMVRWGPNLAGLLCPWYDVRLGEAWRHSAAWKPPATGQRLGLKSLLSSEIPDPEPHLRRSLIEDLVSTNWTIPADKTRYPKP